MSSYSVIGPNRLVVLGFMGGEGWEAVGYDRTDTEDMGHSYEYLFKRPVAGT
jgi:hypothetical protein